MKLLLLMMAARIKRKRSFKNGRKESESSGILTSLASILARRPIPEINSGFRIFKRDLALRFMHLYPNGFSFTPTITLSFFTHGFTVKYVPVHYFKRKGSSSIRPIRDFIGFTTL